MNLLLLSTNCIEHQRYEDKTFKMDYFELGGEIYLHDLFKCDELTIPFLKDIKLVNNNLLLETDNSSYRFLVL